MTPLTLLRPRDEWQPENYKQSTTTRIVPCGKCADCLKDRSAQWAFRLCEELKISSSACFLTLTYAEAPLSTNGNPTLVKSDFQKYMKRLRSKTPNIIKYYACGEYGEQFGRPHYHAIVFNLPTKIIQNSITHGEKIWQHGIVDTLPATSGSIRYCTNYVMKPQREQTNELDDWEQQFSLMSKGLGKNWLKPDTVKNYQNKQIPYIIQGGGIKHKMPRYFKDIIYTPQEKALQALVSEEYRDTYLNAFQSPEAEVLYRKRKTWKHQKESLISRKQL
jgi:hypothetical protein